MLLTSASILALACACYALIKILSLYKNRQFIAKQSGRPLTDAQKKGLAYGGILFAMRDENILTFYPDKNILFYPFGLKNQWQITCPTEAKEAINELLERQRSQEYDLSIQHSTLNTDLIWKAISRQIDIPVTELKDTTSTYAWDLARAVSLSKWCYWCGYITEDETWDFISSASSQASELGSNWRDYTISFLLGRTIQGFDLDDVALIAKALINGQASDKTNKIQDIDIYQRFDFKT
jgi:hypothetical protein